MSDGMQLSNENILRAQLEPAFRTQLLEANLQLVYKALNRYCNKRSPDYDDLFQEVCITFLNCIEGFNPAEGAKFSSYFYQAVYREIIRYREDQARTRHLKIPQTFYKLVYKVDRLHAEQPSLSEQELAERLQVPIKSVHRALELLRMNRPLQLDSAVMHGEDSCLLSEVIASQEDVETEVLERITKEQRFDQFWGMLSKKQRQMMSHLLNGISPIDIARKLGVTRQAISGQMQHIYKKVIPKLNAAWDH